MSELGGSSVAQTLTNIDVQLKSFPHPPHGDDSFIGIIQRNLSIIVMLCFMFVAIDICYCVVLEKEKKLKAGVMSRWCFFSGFQFESLDFFSRFVNTRVHTLPYMVMARNQNEAVTQLAVNDFCKCSFGVDNVVGF